MITSSLPGWIAASAAAAICTLARCASAVMGSPRRSRALPPSATTMRMALIPEGRDQDRFDRVHAIFGLLERDIRFRLEHFLGDLHGGDAELLVNIAPHLRFEIVERGKTMHELGARIVGCLHPVGVDLIWLE